MKNRRKPPPVAPDPLGDLDPFDAVVLRLDVGDKPERLAPHRGAEWLALVERFRADAAFRALIDERFPPLLPPLTESDPAS